MKARIVAPSEVYRTLANELVEKLLVRTILDGHSGLPLIAQLRYSIDNKTSLRGNGSGSKRSVIIDVNAFDLLVKLESSWKSSGMTLEESLASWHTSMAICNDIDEWKVYVTHLELMVFSIENLLDPPPKWHLAFACPECHVKMVHYADVEGDMLQKAALIVDVITGIECLACESRWTPDQFVDLAEYFGTYTAPVW